MNPAYRPMLATLVDEPFDSTEWVFETKWAILQFAVLGPAAVSRAGDISGATVRNG